MPWRCVFRLGFARASEPLPVPLRSATALAVPAVRCQGPASVLEAAVEWQLRWRDGGGPRATAPNTPPNGGEVTPAEEDVLRLLHGRTEHERIGAA